jgi:hypothetical protein
MTYTDALTRIAQINSEIASLQSAFSPSSSTTTQPASSTGASTTFSSALATALGSSGVSGGAGIGSTTLPTTAAAQMTTGQQAFASRLAADTGLDPGVISAWLLAEENGGAAQSRQSASNNDWLNIGYTDSGTYGSSDSVWSDPITAADATAGWLKGQNTIPGYGTASSGIQAILQTAGQPPATQIAAIQGSGWASSGYPDLPSLYQQVAG